jgi:hypothetical protein
MRTVRPQDVDQRHIDVRLDREIPLAWIQVDGDTVWRKDAVYFAEETLLVLRVLENAGRAHDVKGVAIVRKAVRGPLDDAEIQRSRCILAPPRSEIAAAGLIAEARKVLDEPSRAAAHVENTYQAPIGGKKVLDGRVDKTGCKNLLPR